MSRNIEAELVGLETRYWQALKDNDVDAAMDLTDFPCLVSGREGAARLDRETYESMMKFRQWQLTQFEIRNPHVRLLNDDTAIVTYLMHREMHADGESSSHEVANCSTWVRRNGSWACAQHSEAIVGE